MTIEQSKKEKKMPVGIQIKHLKNLNNMVEQDHRFIDLSLNKFITTK